MAFSHFHEIFREEIVAINARRGRLGRPDVVLEQEGIDAQDQPILRPTQASDLVGLSLSGGGIRSASFCLGGMQALDTFNILDRVDYLSSVSGGGYIGTSVSAAMSVVADGRFPFPSELKQDEPAGLQHIRDHSNYLFPQGAINLFSNIVVYLRGLVANALLIVPVLLIAAAITIYSNPDFVDLDRTNVVGVAVTLPVQSRFFGITINSILAYLILLAIWALFRSVPWRRRWNDVGTISQIYGWILIAILVVAFCELQPIVLFGMFVSTKMIGSGGISGQVVGWMKALAVVLAPVATVIGFAGRFLGDALKKTADNPGYKATMARFVMKLAIIIAAAALPLILWVVYLYFSYWGIRNESEICNVTVSAGGSGYCHTPGWLASFSLRLFGDVSLAYVYTLVGVPALVLGLLLRPNANSLHRLYRDRLSKAFLFDPRAREAPSDLDQKMRQVMLGTVDTPHAVQDLKPLDDFCIHAIKTEYAPYHLINAALNIGGSKYANRRGRNADFFIFSPKFTGSEATRYVPTEQIETDTKQLNLATAMAISGAAASSNMGSKTIKPLTPTLALLNVRLGFWLINPLSVAAGRAKPSLKRLFERLYFVKEMFGRLAEDGELVYLTDGGHIENLGIYELLRRRCQMIIAIDAEADPKMSFGSLVTLERYARIDLGTRIDLPWASIREATAAASEVVAKTGGVPPADASMGPHCAIGTIAYPGGREGILIYVKSSLTGDENDYVIDYKRRYPEFPHETTADQLFSEEQFEVYRALGFHAVQRCLNGTDLVAMRPTPAQLKDAGLQAPLVENARRILGLDAG